MIDMHSHIIPSIDDGSKSVQETFDMIKEAKKIGFTDIIMTPHFLLDYYEPTPQEIIFWKNKLQEVLENQDINLNLHSGMEVYIFNKLEEFIKQNKILTLGKSRYLLIELPLSTTVNYLDHILFALQSIGIKPIIAHPERYKCVQDEPNLVQDYIDKGALIQCNYGSILELYGKNAKKTVKILLKRNQVDFLGSDCHKTKTVYPIIPQAIKKIKKIIGDEEFYKISTENPKKVLDNQEW
ncbi:MAG: capsular biosynthesis protein [Clostridiales bacterium]|nr:capsular biosynthesis protein [Clostridiales bacterium]